MKNFSTSIQRKKRGKRTEYIARLSYYDKTGKRKGVSKSAATHYDAKRKLQDLIDQHVAGGSEVLEARNMTFAALGKRIKKIELLFLVQRIRFGSPLSCRKVLFPDALHPPRVFGLFDSNQVYRCS